MTIRPFSSIFALSIRLAYMGFGLAVSTPILCSVIHGQENGDPLRIEQAERLESTNIDETFDLSGNVQMLHGLTALTSDRVVYDRMGRVVQLIGNVMLEREGSLFYADRVVYYESDRRAIGKGKVKLDHRVDDIVLTGDEITYTWDPYYAIAMGSPVMSLGQDGSHLTIRGQQLEYFFSESNSLQKAIAQDSVIVEDATEGLQIFCDRVEFFNDMGIARFHGKPRLRKILNSPEEVFTVTGLQMTYAFGPKTTEVFNRVEIQREGLQGQCDTLFYDTGRQTIELKSNPVIQNAQSEIRGDHILLKLADGKVSKAVVTGQAKGAYSAEPDSGKAQSTIEGRRMIIDFEDEWISRITASENAVSIYNPATMENGPSGKNTIRAKEIVIEMQDGKPFRVTAQGHVDGIYLMPENQEKDPEETPELQP